MEEDVGGVGMQEARAGVQEEDRAGMGLPVEEEDVAGREEDVEGVGVEEEVGMELAVEADEVVETDEVDEVLAER